jgi:hypothetical protein
MTYRAPVNDMLFMMRHVGELDRAIRDGIYPDVSIDLVQDILEEAARFSGEVLAPINRPGDRHGAQLRDGTVTTAPGFRQAYQAWTAAGWNALAGPAEYGGQGLPHLVNAGCFEMWNGACLAFSVAPLLTFGGVEALAAHGSEDLKQRYLAKLVAGEWTATMNLTEPQAGSDLSTIRTRAEPCGDGSYRNLRCLPAVGKLGGTRMTGANASEQLALTRLLALDVGPHDITQSLLGRVPRQQAYESEGRRFWDERDGGISSLNQGIWRWDRVSTQWTTSGLGSAT